MITLVCNIVNVLYINFCVKLVYLWHILTIWLKPSLFVLLFYRTVQKGGDLFAREYRNIESDIWSEKYRNCQRTSKTVRNTHQCSRLESCFVSQSERFRTFWNALWEFTWSSKRIVICSKRTERSNWRPGFVILCWKQLMDMLCFCVARKVQGRHGAVGSRRLETHQRLSLFPWARNLSLIA